MEIVVPEEFRHLFSDSPDVPLVKIPAEVLRQVAAPVDRISKRHRLLADNMIKVMRTAHGIGLAAPQVGVSERIIVIAPDGQKPTIIYNPEITKTEGVMYGEEGCLSIPGLYGDVERYAYVEVKGLDRKGRSSTWDMEGMAARVVQHEIDHLDGVLFTDKVLPETVHWRIPDAYREDE